jgi:hypothetical protein
MLQQKIRRSLVALFGGRDYSRLTVESRKITTEAKRITREDMEAMTTQELQRRALYESLAEHQRLIQAEEDACKLWD